MCYKTCPHCGAHLAPDEKCDCTESLRAEAKALILTLTDEQISYVLEQLAKEKAALGAANTQDGRGEQSIADVVQPPLYEKTPKISRRNTQ